MQETKETKEGIKANKNLDIKKNFTGLSTDTMTSNIKSVMKVVESYKNNQSSKKALRTPPHSSPRPSPMNLRQHTTPMQLCPE